jgi:hypothetical protein
MQMYPPPGIGLDALTSGIINLESSFPEGNLTQDLSGLGRSPARRLGVWDRQS